MTQPAAVRPSPAVDYPRVDATDLAAAIHAGALSADEAVAQAFDAIDRINPRLNAVILTMREAAHQQLQQLPSTAPLRGVPILLKDDCPAYAGTPMSFGSRAAVGHVSAQDHEIVTRYRAAGLVVVGKTNLPEFSANVATEPTLHGPTLNPWNPAYSIGGSSGGAAAAVAAGLVPIAYGNDGAGSIRIPASCAGVFGLRPSRGRVPSGSVAGENWGGLVSHHVLSRSVRDSALMLDLTDSPIPGALYAAPAKPGSFVQACLDAPRPLRIGVIMQGGMGTPISGAVAQGLDEIAALCRRLGHEVVPTAFDFDAAGLADAFLTLIASYTAIEVADVARTMGRPINADYFEPVNLGLAEYGRSLGATDLLRARATANSVAHSLGRTFCNVDLLMTPVLPQCTSPVGELDVRSADWRAFADRFMHATVFTRPANAAGIPAMSVPLCQDASGLPLGIQFMAPYGDEASLFSLAAQLERAQPWACRLPPIHA